MRIVHIILALLLTLSVAFAQGPPQSAIPPKKGDVTKNIHIVFDKSGSMDSGDFARGYAEVEKIIMQSSDEFNLAITVFADGHIRMPVNDKECKLGKNWLAMPSAIHYKNIMKWIKNNGPRDGSTDMKTAIDAILKENKKGVTVIIISDCIIYDVVPTLRDLKVAMAVKGKKKKHPIKMGFVNVSGLTTQVIYKEIVKHKCWYIPLTGKKREVF